MINEIYTIGMIQTNIKQMSKLKEDKKMSWGENIWCKWYNNKPVLILVRIVDGMNGISTVMRQTKGSATKTPVSCPNIINF